MLYIASKKRGLKSLQREFPGAIFADVTSQAKDGLVKLSPFYPHGDIPVPFSPGKTSACVEAIWQGLKVFEQADIDTALFSCTTMKNIKRTVRKYGSPLGHRKGVDGTELLGYLDARRQIYLPAYKWMLEHKVHDIISRLAEASRTKDIVLLDYNTNENVFDLSKPLSHAALVKAYVEKCYPDGGSAIVESSVSMDVKNASSNIQNNRKRKGGKTKKEGKKDILFGASQLNLFE
ncbi:hypothetical protein [uncultured Alistipes sp.]|jgi:hypothetical protein|uniref:DUF6939 family protein n=1 Tax=uncultured Alistipes sp. TaxID=538949 RepID=UPI00259A766C|nr:hypothetical protein [uncultured Alistipes sp.]